MCEFNWEKKKFAKALVKIDIALINRLFVLYLKVGTARSFYILRHFILNFV